jgi:Ca2+-binding RTX toxin-like protein
MGGGAGNDILSDSAGPAVLRGGADNDILIGGTGEDYLYGEDGNDMLYGGTGVDTLDGGAGDDRLEGGDALDTGDWYVHDWLTGGPGADTFVFASTAGPPTTVSQGTIVFLGSINDLEASDIIDLAGIDANTSIGGNQDFTFLGLGAADLTVGQGQLKYYQYGGTTYLVGNATADNQADFQIQINGLYNVPAEQILGLAPPEVNDPPNDIMVVGGGALAANEFVANGTLVGTVVGQDPDSTVLTYSLVDDADGRFTINAGTGAITVASGLLLDFEQNPTHVIRVRVEDQALGAFEKDFTVAINNVDPENIVGDATANTFVGGALNDVLSGAGGLDVLLGGAGNDTLSGNAGQDVLTGGLGRDTLSGGTEADQFVFTSTADSVVGANRDVITDWGSSDKLDLAAIDANASVGGNQDFTFLGCGTADLTVGQGQLKYYQYYGNTYVVGNATADNQADFQIKINGLHNLTADQIQGLANAVLTGTSGNDTLIGTSGNDILTGLLGADTLSGRAGADTFVFKKTADSPVGANRDVITDWESSDVINLAAIDANTSIWGNQDFTFLGLGAADLTVGQGQLKYYQSGGNTYVVGNATADNQADFQIQISGVHTLAADDLFGLA